MGQKVHPLGFRLGITEEHKTKWYANFADYAEQLKVTDEMRNIWTELLKEISKKQLEETTDRTNILLSYPPTHDQVQVTIFCVNPELVISDLKALPYQIRLSKALGKELSRKNLVVVLKKVKSPLVEPNFLLQSMAKKLEKRMPFRRAIRSTLTDFKKGSKQAKLDPRQRGIKIQVSGRLNGAEIARTEWVREGKVPLHTLQAKLEYSTARAETIYGTLGLKVWICKG
uniref:Small ribosomal subunit protein uS3c n=1 Tax=Characiopsis acuta TaxID=2040456 RepID=A0A451FLL1_9STRA|nr:ribosomal protein S3 [Characiopsis acuta]QAA11258.1 ribosomal protein S3 [Characiopsis acuta]